MQTLDIEIVNRLGLHARAATKLVQTASQFAAEVHVVKDGQRVSGKSILGVMMLAAAKGSQISLEAEGADETEALQALETLIKDRFGEGE
ncbi:MAG: HPr family phosphocarrier protein [Gammaproteobacteria bacterium]|nr:HPr family phosphocarrier protein [Gammaproteobacteria bacterium]